MLRRSSISRSMQYSRGACECCKRPIASRLTNREFRFTIHALESRSREAGLSGNLLGALSLRTRLLIGTWLTFCALIAIGVHGSSIACTASAWALGSPDSTYLFSSLLPKIRTASLPREGLAMARSRDVRSDEWIFYTP